jgi:hypothetical protein
MLLFLSFFQGCMYYYKVKTVATVAPQNIKTCDSLNKLLVLHQKNSAWQLSGYASEGNMLTGKLSLLPSNCQQYKTTHAKGGNKYRRADRILVLNQVHLYVNDSVVPTLNTGDEIKIDFSAIRKAEAYVKAKGRTTTSWVVPIAIGTVAVTAVTIGVVAVLTKSSCPLIYIKKDSSFTFSGEIFGGAIYSSLERHDWLPLPGFEAEKNRYELKITNGLPEIQYINLSELWIVNHPARVKVLPDRRGIIHTIGRPELPMEALSSANSDIFTLIRANDRSCFQFDETPALTGDSCAFNAAIFTFPVPDNADTGKLVVTAGNSIWGDYAFGELTKLFGNRYEEFISWQGKRSPEKTLQWQKDQRYPLMVYLETSAGWQFVDNFDLIGPLGAREMVMPVDIVQPATAITETGKDVAQLLSWNDHRYYVQEKTGEEGLIVYPDSPAVPGMKKSVFLHTKGYYTHVRNYPDPPDKKQLKTFLVAGRFSRFSYEKYTDFVQKKMVFVSDPRLP